MSNIFSKQPIEVPNKSGFNKSYQNLFTAPVGTLVPMVCKEVIPGEKINLSTQLQVQLPPMATDFYGRVRGKLEAFFVPNRILYGGWKSFISQMNSRAGLSTTMTTFYPDKVPTITLQGSADFGTSLTENFGRGSLADYLGMKFNNLYFNENSADFTFSALPFIAYHRIYDDWYRNPRLSRPLFVPLPNSTSGALQISANTLPFQFVGNTINEVIAENTQFGKGISGFVSPSDLNPIEVTDFRGAKGIFALRQRNFARDYFSNANYLPQSGNAASVAVSSNSFTIQQLRAANTLQKFMERQNIAGLDYGDNILAMYGVYPSDATTQKSIYLGSATFDIYNKSVYQNAPSSSASGNNPFTSVGSKYSNPMGFLDSSRLVNGQTFNEHGFLFVMFSIVPDRIYATGLDRKFMHLSFTDFAIPQFASIGDQAIAEAELIGEICAGYNRVFGYTQRYSEYKFNNDEVHGLLSDTKSLSAFAIQTSFSTVASLGNGGRIGPSFGEIPTTYLDQVSAVKAQKTSNFGAWIDSYIDYRSVLPLPEYSIPTLGEERDTHTIVVPSGGKML